MRVYFNIPSGELDNFNNRCEVAISRVGNGSRKALVEACEEISNESLAQVPYDTGTLMMSQFWEIQGHWRTGWSATIGYGGNGNPINPKSGKPASQYMIKVHEDLTVHHPIGKAKFLEDPVRNYTAEKFPRTVLRHVSDALEGV